MDQSAGPYVRKLTLTDFRNYSALSLDLEPGMVVFSGENGAGKTNLLEAISLLTPGRGLRRAPYGEVAREGSTGGFAVHAQLDGAKGPFDIGTGTAGLDPNSDAGRRVRINSTQTAADDLLDVAAQLTGGEARFMLADAGSPTLIQDTADENALYVLMPMRV